MDCISSADYASDAQVVIPDAIDEISSMALRIDLRQLGYAFLARIRGDSQHWPALCKVREAAIDHEEEATRYLLDDYYLDGRM